MGSWKRPSNKAGVLLLAADEPGSIDRCADFVRQGDLVVFPTDTVYGIGADAFNADAIYRLYQAKQRPFAKGIPLLLADWSDMARAARDIPDCALTFIRNFWPGPLTLIVPRHPQMPAILAPDDTIAIRMPDSQPARALIRAAGGLMAASSANISGNPPLADGRLALQELGDWVTAVLDAGPASENTASTVVDCTGAFPRLLREGPITAAALRLETAKTL